MPTISVQRGELFRRLGREYTDKEIDALCFAFGLELDEVVELGQEGGGPSSEGEGGVDDATLKIEVPANRYDLLCVEGIARALRAFGDPAAAVLPQFRLLPETPRYTMTVKQSVDQVRPYVVCAILRDVTLSAAALKSFIDFQDKLHHTLCRRRALVAIGTHDLNKVTPPFFYDARPPVAFSFVPLGCEKEMTGTEALEYLSHHLQLKAYVPLVASSPVLPLVLDSADHILSLPPLINANFCRVTEQTKNLFIECTANDMTKAKLVLNMLVAAFSEYCATPYTVEPIRVVYEQEEREEEKKNKKGEKEADKSTTEEKAKEKQRTRAQATAKETATSANEKDAQSVEKKHMSHALHTHGGIYPQIQGRRMSVSLDYIRGITGLRNLTAQEAVHLLKKMMLSATVEPVSDSRENERLLVSIPITRSDILHECDVAEDVAIAFGFNKLPVHPSPFLSVVPLRALSDRVRSSVSLCGYTETLTFTLVAAGENYSSLGRKPAAAAGALLDPTQYQLHPSPVRLANAKTREFEQVRTTLIPGVLKTILHNKGRRELPIKCFEVGDICVLDPSTTTGARNLRYCCVAISDERFSGLEDVHGVLDVVMQELRFTADYTIAELEAAAAAAAAASSSPPPAASAAGAETAPSHSDGDARVVAAMGHLRKVLDRSLGTFKLTPSHENLFLAGRQVHIAAAPTTEGGVEQVPKLVGIMGTVHPNTLKAFGLSMPVIGVKRYLEAQEGQNAVGPSLKHLKQISLFEMNLEAFGSWLPSVEIEG